MGFDKNKLKITPSSFQDAKELERVISLALKSSSMSFDLGGIDKDNVLNSEIKSSTIGEFLRSILSISSSKEVENQLFVCCQRAIYDNEKINLDFFDKVENRPLYYPIMIEIIKVNVLPFLENLFSQFSGFLKKIK